jgi:hypothetical protein
MAPLLAMQVGLQLVKARYYLEQLLPSTAKDIPAIIGACRFRNLLPGLACHVQVTACSMQGWAGAMVWLRSIPHAPCVCPSRVHALSWLLMMGHGAKPLLCCPGVAIVAAGNFPAHMRHSEDHAAAMRAGLKHLVAVQGSGRPAR